MQTNLLSVSPAMEHEWKHAAKAIPHLSRALDTYRLESHYNRNQRSCRSYRLSARPCRGLQDR